MAEPAGQPSEHAERLARERPEWVTLAEAAFLAGVPISDIRRWLGDGVLERQPLGRKDPVVLIRMMDVLAAIQREQDDGASPARFRPPVEPRSPKDRPRIRVGRRPAARTVVTTVAVTMLLAGSGVLAFFGPSWLGGAGAGPPAVPAAAAARIASSSQDVVGRDPFATPFVPAGRGRYDIIVKPPVAIRHGSALSAAAVVVNQSAEERLPPTQLLFVARDATGKVVGRRAVVVSLEPGRSTTVVAEGIDVGAARPITLEARLGRGAEPEAERSRPPEVRITDVRPTADGRAVTGRITTRSSRSTFQVGCALFDADGQLAAVGFTTVQASRGLFSIPTRPVRSGPYDASCFVG